MINKTVIKRDGREKEFCFDRIHDAIRNAYKEVSDELTFKEDYNFLKPMIEERINKINDKTITIEEIQDIVVESLFKVNVDVAESYKAYRRMRDIEREHPIDTQILELLENKNEFLAKENSNKRPELVSTQRDLMAGTLSRHLARKKFPKHLLTAWDLGLFKPHDADYMINPITNCELVPLDDMFDKGTVINGKMIETPKSLQTAVTLATQIVVQVTSQTYGGCSISLSHLAPYVRKSKNKYRELIKQEGIETGIEYSEQQISKIADIRLKKEIKDAVQTLNYQINTMSGQNGQTAFLSVFIYLNENIEYREELVLLAEELFKQRIVGMKDEKGHTTTQTFPKLLYVLDENNVYPQSKYFWLTQLAMKCTAIRQAPDYQSAKVMKEIYGDVFPCMGCRSFLFPYKPDGKHFKWYGRANVGVTTLNLPDIALSSKGDMDTFWDIFDDRMENLIKPACEYRYTKLEGVQAKVAPLLWQHGVFARLNPNDYILDVIKKEQFSVSIGYAGLYETVYYMTGESNTTEIGKQFQLQVLKALEDKANKWKEETGLGFSIYGTPIEESTDWFTKKLVARFGIVEGVTDHGYITNSYHVNPHEDIDAFSKLEIEGDFQKYSKGGNVSYIETLGLEHNIDAMYEIIKCIYDNNTHAEINSQSDCYCYKCGYKGQLENENTGDYNWICPNCGNKDQEELNVVIRTCGYLSSKGIYTTGRMKDILSRKVHI